jgi:hypothetical protein
MDLENLAEKNWCVSNNTLTDDRLILGENQGSSLKGVGKSELGAGLAVAQGGSRLA